MLVTRSRQPASASAKFWHKGSSEMSSYIDQLTALDELTVAHKTTHATVFEDTLAQGAEIRYTAQKLMGRHPGFRVGAYYISPVRNVSSTAAAVAANTLYAQPMPFGI